MQSNYSRGAIPRSCEVCGGSFLTTPSLIANGKARYCSKACLGQALSTRLARTCPICGTEFSVKPSLAARGYGLYCSLACRGIAQTRAASATGICPQCGNQFEYMTARPQRHCSKACANASNRGIPRTEEDRRKLSAGRTGKEYPHLRKPALYYRCEECGKTVAAAGDARSRVMRGKSRFCDIACWRAYARKHPEANGNFRGGKDPYYGPNWREQARKARARDGHTCVDCGKHQRKPLLHVHHLKPRRDFHGDYEAANQLDNLVTLCNSCHSIRESQISVAMRR